MVKRIIPIKISIIFILVNCKGLSVKHEYNPSISDPNFYIVINSDEGMSKFNRKVNVFGIDIYAAPKVEDSKLFHAANVLAQYLDNNEDGLIDDQLLINKMIENKSFIVMWKNQRDINSNMPSDRIGQDLGNDETNPSFVKSGKKGRFDASLEEILHLINNAGHSFAYPDAFGQFKGSILTNAMDIARGGQFNEIPDKYPDSAWYSYYDFTCDYETCQTIEYLYWALTSLMGAQKNRIEEIKDEWKLNTRELVQSKDTIIFNLLTNPIYKMPKVLPDGTYKH